MAGSLSYGYSTYLHAGWSYVQVLSCATNDTDNPDLRDRAYIYWRLLSTDPEVGVKGGGGGSCCWQHSQLCR